MITGGCGFIGSALVRRLSETPGNEVLNFDVLTYAADQRSVASAANQANYEFVRGDVRDKRQVADALVSFRPDVIFHLAAESHVDRSIDGPGEFLNTNIFGTFRVLEAVRNWLEKEDSGKAGEFRLVHVSTDEVFGDLGLGDPAFTEESPYKPSSPYSASKASSDHLVRSWGRTFGLPAIVTNCSNNYGPYQFPEKLIPLMILTARADGSLPVYGEGLNIRDWLHVDDHVDALIAVAQGGQAGESFNIGGDCERRNIDVVRSVCGILDQLVPKRSGSYTDQITYVTDRKGHDLRYAVDSSKLTERLGWKPAHDFESGLKETVQWYLDNEDWWRPHFERKSA